MAGRRFEEALRRREQMVQQAVFGSGVETQPNDKDKEKHIISDEFVNEP